MNRASLKEYLERDVPHVDYEILKGKTLRRVLEYEKRAEQHGTYVAPRGGLLLITLLLLVNVYALGLELMAHVYMWGNSFSASRLSGALLAIIDNVFSITVNCYLGILMNRRFLGLSAAKRSIVRGIKNGIALAKSLLQKPAPLHRL